MKYQKGDVKYRKDAGLSLPRSSVAGVAMPG